MDTSRGEDPTEEEATSEELVVAHPTGEVEEEGRQLLDDDMTEAPIDILSAQPEELQQSDPTLRHVRDRLDGQLMEDQGSNAKFYYRDGLIYRSWKKRGSKPGLQEFDQLVQYRSIVLRLAHEVPMSGTWE